MSVFIKAENLSFIYPDDPANQIPAVNNVSFQINEGEYIAILGHNGSGKSTLAKLMNLILTPTSGKITVTGKEVTPDGLSDEDVFEVRRKIGMVFQNPDNQLVATIVEEDVAFGPENLGIPPKEIRERVDMALATVGMSEYAKHEPHRLSGGQKQRVAIAGIIAMTPSCIIFDESTAMLDPLGRREVVDTMEKLNRENGITVINITHYMNEAARADRVIVMNDGRIFLDDTPKKVFSKTEKLRSVGLDVPQCTALLYELKKRGLCGDDSITDVNECARYLCKLIKPNGTEK